MLYLTFSKASFKAYLASLAELNSSSFIHNFPSKFPFLTASYNTTSLSFYAYKHLQFQSFSSSIPNNLSTAYIGTRCNFRPE